MERLFWIALGGAVGTSARYGIGLWAAARFSGPLPVGTIAVNLIGCFAIALIISVASGVCRPTTNCRSTVTSFDNNALSPNVRGATSP